MSNLHRQNLQFTSSQVAEAMATVITDNLPHLRLSRRLRPYKDI